MLALFGSFAAAQEQNLFNGKDLTGWDAAPDSWYVEDGALTCESTADKPCKKCNYLIWKGGQPGDFELTADFKLSAAGNSGIQIRSEARPDWDTFGYQADMDGSGRIVGYVYHHKRGLIAARGEKVTITAEGKKEVENIGDSAELLKAFHKEDWNKYRIVCRGPDITLYINEVMMCQITDNDQSTAKSEGIIALQMHPGPPMKIQFKNIVLKEFNQEKKLIAVLKSNAEYKEKSDACRELALIGTSSAVPALAALLTDEKLSHMARYGLEPIPYPAVDDVLRDAISKVKGPQLAGVISSIGIRRDEKAVGALVGLLKDPDAAIAQEAARALGTIGTADAAKGLNASLGETQAETLMAVCDGLFRCAEAFKAKGQDDQAIAIYDSLRGLQQAPRHVRAGALRGAVLTRQKDGLPLLVEAIHSADYGLVQATAKIALETKDSEVVKMLAEEIGKLPVDRQLLLIGVLGKRGDNAALPALIGMAKAGDKSVRLAAIKAATEINNASTSDILIELLKDQDGDVVQTAAASLAGLRGIEVDNAIIKMLDTPDQALKIKMVEMTAIRRIMNAMPILLKLMENEDKALRLAAVKSYGDLSGVEQIPNLLDRIIKNTNGAEINALEKALGSICGIAADPNVCVSKIVEALNKAVNEAKPSLLKTLRVAGGAEALKAVRGAVDDANKDVHTAAIRVISEWRTDDAIPVLLDLAKKSTEEVDKILSLRGYLGMAVKNEVSPQARLAICRESVPLIKRDDEKRILLGALSSMANAESLALIIPYLDDAAVKNEAISTCMAVAEKRARKQNTAVAKQALEKVIKAAADDEKVVKRANELLKQVEEDGK